MTVDEWIAALHARVIAPGRIAPERSIAYLRPRLDDLPPEWFTMEAVDAIFRDMRSLSSSERVRTALRDFHTRQARPPSTASAVVSDADRLEQAAADYAREWDDPPGIMRAIAKCEGRMMPLRYLGFVLAHHAPQHLSLLPPHVIEVLAREGTPHMRRLFASHYVDLGAQPANDLDRPETRAEPVAHYLTPEQLDRVNPLPGGRKRASPEAAP